MKMMNDFELYIQQYLKKQPDCLITEAMAYSLQGGKRFRPRIIFAMVKGMGLEESVAYDAALALELIQTYSLIHDDLPAMDNDDLRRGKPSLHKAFREDIAILAGDELLTDAFKVLAHADYNPEIRISMIKAFSRYAGSDGMIYGQLLDVTADEKGIDLDKLIMIQENKTGGLFKIACLCAMYLGQRNNEEYYLKLGRLIGLIFQNQDDLFDMIKTEQEMGKNLSDQKNGKGTALSLYSVDELKELIEEEFTELDSLLQEADFDTACLNELLRVLKER